VGRAVLVGRRHKEAKTGRGSPRPVENLRRAARRVSERAAQAMGRAQFLDLLAARPEKSRPPSPPFRHGAALHDDAHVHPAESGPWASWAGRTSSAKDRCPKLRQSLKDVVVGLVLLQVRLPLGVMA